MSFEEWEVKYFFERYNCPYENLINEYLIDKYGEKYIPARNAWVAASASILESWNYKIKAISGFNSWVYNKKESGEEYTIREAWDAGYAWGITNRDELRRMGGEVFS